MANEVAYLSHHAIIAVVIIVVITDRTVWIDHPPPLANSTQLNSKVTPKKRPYPARTSLLLLFRQLESNMAAPFHTTQKFAMGEWALISTLVWNWLGIRIKHIRINRDPPVCGIRWAPAGLQDPPPCQKNRSKRAIAPGARGVFFVPTNGQAGSDFWSWPTIFLGTLNSALPFHFLKTSSNQCCSCLEALVICYQHWFSIWLFLHCVFLTLVVSFTVSSGFSAPVAGNTTQP